MGTKGISIAMKEACIVFGVLAMFVHPLLAQTVDILKSFQTGREWTYLYSISGMFSVAFPSDTTTTITTFSGTHTLKIERITFDSAGGVQTFHLKLRTKGTEKVITRVRTVSTREIDTAYSSSVVENFNLNYRASTHHIQGWLFPEVLPGYSRRCPRDTATIYYPYLRYFRYYSLASQDTFERRGNRLVFRSLFTDCLDNARRIIYTIVPDSGLVEFMVDDWGYFFPSTTTVFQFSKITNVEHTPLAPEDFALYQNYPNPFNPTTRIEYTVGSKQHVSIKVYDILGREVRELVNEWKEPGKYSVVWDGQDNFGDISASGMYFYRMQVIPMSRDDVPQSGITGAFVQTKKLMLLR
jgi:hypothetical protein